MKAIMLLIFIAIAGQFMSDEIKSWSIWLHAKLRRIAVGKLPTEFRDRYDEEWESGLVEVPGEIFKLLYSTGLIWAAVGIRRASLKSAAESKRAFTLLKRLFDIGFSSLVLVLLLPLLVAISLAIKLSSGGPIFYGAQRIGKNGRVFHCFGFRTITPGRRTNIAHPTDPKVTSVGRLLRMYSLDVLPQFFNVLRGDMSIVGPRPPIANKACLSEQHIQPDVTPGITGLWQIQAYQDSSTENCLKLDEDYAKNRSLLLDLKIILRTILVVISGTGT
ncbi:MAG: sugar transferase [Acidobacteriota bacterium]